MSGPSSTRSVVTSFDLSPPNLCDPAFVAFCIMVALGYKHAVLLRNDGTAVACGDNAHAQCNLPVLDEDLHYTHVSASGNTTVLLKSNGEIAHCGCTRHGQCNIPMLDEGVSYTQVASGMTCAVLLRNDGRAVACGNNDHLQLHIPNLPEGMRYVQVAAGCEHLVLLKDDGSVVACGRNTAGQCDTPAAGDGLRYTAVAAGGDMSVLIRNNGTVAVFGKHAWRDGISRPCLTPHEAYKQVSVGFHHGVLLKDDGTAVHFGLSPSEIPALSGGLLYTGASAGFSHTILLRSDGSAILCGPNVPPAIRIPILSGCLSYTCRVEPQLVLEGFFRGGSFDLCAMNGLRVSSFTILPADTYAEIYTRINHVMQVQHPGRKYDVIVEGKLLSGLVYRPRKRLRTKTTVGF